MENAAIRDKLKFSTKVGYGMGDIFGGGALTIISLYYLHFLTDVAGLNPILAGVIFFISKVWSAVADPVMGIISDRTRTKMGRRRPYFLAGMICIVVTFFLMWNPLRFQSQAALFTYFLLAFIFFQSTFTMVWVPYTALASELTESYDERTKLATFRMVFSVISGIFCATVPLELVKRFDDFRIGYMAMALIFGLFFALPYIVTLITTYERKDFQKEVSTKSFKEIIRENFTEPFKVRPFRHISVMYLCCFVSTDIIMALMIYFVTYYVHMENIMTPLLGTIYVVMVFFTVVFDFVARKWSKRTAFMAASIIWILSFIYVFTITPGSATWMILTFGVIFGIATAGIHVMVFAIFPDIPDVDELVSGVRREGIFSGMFSFLRKTGSALALFLVSSAIGWAGYVKPIEETVNGVSRLINQAQNDEFILTIRLLFSILPIILVCISLIACYIYPVTPEIHSRLKNYLDRKRAGETWPEMEAEAQWLKAKLL